MFFNIFDLKFNEIKIKIIILIYNNYYINFLTGIDLTARFNYYTGKKIYFHIDFFRIFT